MDRLVIAVTVIVGIVTYYTVRAIANRFGVSQRSRDWLFFTFGWVFGVIVVAIMETLE